MASVWFGYDLLNRTLYAHFGSATGRGETDVYDALGRLTSSTQSTSPTFSNTLAYQYDLAGDRTRITWPDGFYAAYIYDVLQRPIQIQENGATSGRGLLASYIYDTLGRRSEIDRAGGTGATTNLAYAYDQWISSLAQNLHGSVNDVTFTPTFSPAFQAVTKGVTNDAYTFHPGGLSKSYTPNGLNQYASVSGTSFSYDSRGNLSSDGTRSFTYDLENRLLTASAPTAVSLGYDPLGRLQTSAAGTATITLLYDGSMLAGEYDATNTLQNRYVPGPGQDEPLVWYIGSGTGQRQWLIPDTQGSIIAWTDGAGALIASQAYDPYGGPSTWAGGSRYAYTGQLMIPEAQLYSYKARAYDPGLGRFLQTDPAGYQSDVNWYAYAGNDPLNWSDPSGTVTVEEFVVTAVNTWRQSVEAYLDAFERGVEGLSGQGPGGGSGNAGHDYRTRDKVCRRPLTKAEESDLVSRFGVPSVFSGSPIGNGEYLVTNGSGVPGGFVQTTFSVNGLTATNVTTPVHAFVATIVRSAGNYGGFWTIFTHGFGFAGANALGQLRDQNNQKYGPGIFNQLDQRAAAYAAANYPGC